MVEIEYPFKKSIISNLCIICTYQYQFISECFGNQIFFDDVNLNAVPQVGIEYNKRK